MHNAGMDWQALTVNIIDFEGSPRSGVLEYGVVTMLADNIIQTQTRLCAAEGEYDPAAARTHGIGMREGQEEAPFSAERERFVSMRKQGLFAAHHASVEERFLRAAWPYPGEVPDFTQDSKNTEACWGPWLDTCQLAKTCWPNLPSYKLGELVNTLALQPALDALALEHCPPRRSKAHCALYDALASALILQYLLRETPLRKASVAALVRASASSAEAQQSLSQQELFPE